MRADARSLVVDELRELERVESLAEPWRALCERVAACTPFQYPEWVVPWWRRFGAVDGSPRGLVVRSGAGGDLVGFAALWIHAEDDGSRHAALLGTGNSDYVDILAAPGHELGVLTAFAGYLRDIRAEWDACHLHPLPPASVLLQLTPGDDWSMQRSMCGVFPRLRLRRTATPVKDSIPRSFLAQLAYARRRLERRGAVTVQRAGPSNAASLLADMRALHTRRWRARGEAGVLADARVDGFHAEVVCGMADRGLLRLHVVRVDGAAVAAFYGFALRGCVYYYLGGFDPAFERESVGSLAILAAVEEAAARGDRVIDFLQGAEAYKYRWGAVDRLGHRLSITPLLTEGALSA